jgi:hypothetical protein
MPQELVLMYHVETGEPKRFHSVDAHEAAQLGDYVYEAPKGKTASPQMLAQADFSMRAAQVMPHPELLSPEERAQQRRLANEEAARITAQPVVLAPGGGATVTVAEHPAEESSRSRASARREVEDKK